MFASLSVLLLRQGKIFAISWCWSKWFISWKQKGTNWFVEILPRNSRTSLFLYGSDYSMGAGGRVGSGVVVAVAGGCRGEIWLMSHILAIHRGPEKLLTLSPNRLLQSQGWASWITLTLGLSELRFLSQSYDDFVASTIILLFMLKGVSLLI